ncbi:MAG: hypothetical protein K5899_12140 [Bacteroidaceae bacterium]|nr:hypothetical protein [Bacteroidaceae bacterium]
MKVKTNIKSITFGLFNYKLFFTLLLCIGWLGSKAQTEITSLSQITDVNGKYKLTADISSAGSGLNITFTGTLDGNYHTIKGLSSALFATVNGGTVKNVILDNVNISNGTNVGAICNEATGNAKIYNCGVLATNGSSVSGSGAVGGLVGLIQTGSNVRVVNCYNYATVSGGTYAAGIVGRNQGTISGTTTVNTTGVRITNCMMYGDMTTGTNRSPVYGGNHTNNVQKLTEYNYYRSRANLTYTAYNDQLAIDKNEFLTRFPFYRHIQNTHREMAAYFLFGTGTQKPTAEQVAEIGHWVLKTDVAPYPIIEAWQTNTKRTTVDKAANLPNTSESYAGKLLTEMGNNGYLTVNVSINGSNYSCNLPITDMDTLSYDFTWGKVVLPFANEFENWTRDYSKICTGWKITSITGGTTGTLSNHNYADRDCTAKDLYSNSGYIFAQGGNYIVPYGVTSISIEANFANAFYLSDAQADFGYNNTYGEQRNLAWAVPTRYHGQRVYTSLATLMGSLASTTNPHAQAIVLVGNYHYNQNVTTSAATAFSNNTGKALTIMSVDEDNNQEPDYGWYSYHTTDRTNVPPMRFDFVPNIGIGMTERVTNSTPNPTIGIWHGRTWFELTETCVSFMSECEINATAAFRWIANSGYFIQIVNARQGNRTSLTYIQLGGNVYVEQLYPGPHMAENLNVNLCPIIVTGGEIEECFMTGKDKSGTGTATGNHIYFWCAGGRIHKYLSAYMQKPSQTSQVDVTAKVDHAIIRRFFGGGTSPKARITGNIDITMNNSLVDFYCGGPEFGDMNAGRTVTTHATGTTFGEFYGAGFGGTATTKENQTDEGVTFNTATYTFPSGQFSNYTSKRLTYNATLGGFGANYEFEFILYAGGRNGQGVARFYVGRIDFSLATTGSVTNVLDNCTVKGNFYGAGCQGKVNGTVTSTLTGCTLEGNAFGGGYKAAANEAPVYPTKMPTLSVYTKETGIFSDFGTVEPEIWTWKQGTAGEKDEANKILYTNVVMSELGNVTGDISITVDGGTVAGNVFGGGNESPSRANAAVTVKGDVIVNGDVFGGGNIANVDGSTTVGIQGGTVLTDVYGGGALANTNAISGATTTVNLTGGTVHDVYGGGLGQKNGFFGATSDIEAIVGGDVTVTLNGSNDTGATNDCKVTGNIFGCNNLNGTPKGHVLVHVYKTEGYDEDHKKSNDKDNTTYDVAAVYGGGNMAAYVPTSTDFAEVIIDGCDDSSIQFVYGGGNAASAPATKVTVNGSYEIGNVFGGGNGKDALPNGQANPGADVGYYDVDGTKTAYGPGEARAEILGGTTHYAFGGSNTKGDIRVDATVYLNEADDTCPLQIDEVYGGGNVAYMAGNAQIELGCINYLKEIYGGARNADFGGNIVLTITSGHFERVFGGNNLGGTIGGSITVNIEETGCHPITIGELYGCGNQAAYTTPTGKDDPTINVKSFTSIGRIFGGGLGSAAKVTGNPTVNINEVVGERATYTPWDYNGSTIHYDDGTSVTLPTHESGKIGAIGTVFGGGNAAKVDGNTNVYIGTEPTVTYVSGDKSTKPVVGANIAGNVYGGGNQADVTGKTNVIIGQ